MTYDVSKLSGDKRHTIAVNSNIPRRFIGMEPDDIKDMMGAFSNEIEDWITNVLEGNVIKQLGGIGVTGVGLLFDGGPGLGKTTHAVVTLMELIRRLPEDPKQVSRIFGTGNTEVGRSFRSIYYLTFPEFVVRKKAVMEADNETKRELYEEMQGFHGRAKDDNLNVRILVLDDLGKEYGSKYVDASFDEILRARYDKGLPTIITTNVLREKWAAQYGEAMGSFAYEAFTRIQLGAKDLRKNG
jgi:DNA replication protein DnaC